MIRSTAQCVHALLERVKVTSHSVITRKTENKQLHSFPHNHNTTVSVEVPKDNSLYWVQAGVKIDADNNFCLLSILNVLL